MSGWFWVHSFWSKFMVARKSIMACSANLFVSHSLMRSDLSFNYFFDFFLISRKVLPLIKKNFETEGYLSMALLQFWRSLATSNWFCITYNSYYLSFLCSMAMSATWYLASACPKNCLVLKSTDMSLVLPSELWSVMAFLRPWLRKIPSLTLILCLALWMISCFDLDSESLKRFWTWVSLFLKWRVGAW